MLRQSLQQKLLQKLSPQQIQLMKLLQLPTVALEARIKEELEANPGLEEGKEHEANDDPYADNNDDNHSQEEEFDWSDYMDDDTPSYKTSVSNRGADDEEVDMPYSAGTTFHERLEAQLNLRILTEQEMEIGLHLIGNLDEAGYLRRELFAIVDDLAFSRNIMTTEEELERVLKVVQQLDPPGVGARSLQECLLIQLKRKDVDAVTYTARVILEDCFEEFTKKHYDKIQKKLDIEQEDLRDAVEEILKLNPKPGNSSNTGQRTMGQIIPDFSISVEDGEVQLSLNGRNAPELRMSRSYSEMVEGFAAMKNPTKSDKEAMTFVKQKLDSAKWFIDAIKQRQHTLMFTMNAIIDLQKEYFLTGDETKLKPMILKDIAEVVGLDISTVSRVANSKYVATPYGTFLLKTFFSESLSTDSGEEVSTREVKGILQDSIGKEDKRKPLTDDRLTGILKEKGYQIARRTVAKYREQLGIPVARLRKEI